MKVNKATLFFLGFLVSLIFIELTNGKPAVKAKQYKMDERFLHSPQNNMYPIKHSNQSDSQDTFNNQRPK